MGPVAIGIDIGKQRDPTAICVAEVDRRSPAHYLVRHLERVPLDTSYPEVAERIRSVVSAVAQRSGRQPATYIDATGVGAPVLDLLRERAPELRSAVAVIFTSGNRRKVHPRGGKVTLGKARLVSRLQSLLNAGRLHLPQTSEAEALGRELQTYEIRVDDNGRARFGAFKSGAHDDLVTALALAIHTDSASGTL